MPVYADVAAVVIQGWLSRTPRLKGRRGASTMLRDATAAQAIAALLPPGVQVNPDAGDVDGVVNLVGADPETVQAAAQAVAAHLRLQLPGLELRCAQAEAPDYFIAYRAMRAQLAGGRGQEWQPAVSEVPFARLCSYCGQDPATGTADLSPDEPGHPVCGDCAARLRAAGRARDPRHTPGPEQRVAGWLAGAGERLDFPDDFAALAAQGMGDRTHIATIYADGNRIGTLFDLLKGTSAGKAEVARGIDGAGRAAFIEAAQVVAREEVVPVVPHLVGGDDLLVSVPAACAWQFTWAYLRGFGAAVAAWAAANRITPPIMPSASAGVVIHHHAHPFAMAVEQASRALTLAKREFTGRQAAIAWADVSAEGYGPQSGPSDLAGPRTLDWFDRNAEILRQLAEVKPAQRATLSRLPDAELPEQVRRMNIKPAKDLLTAGPADLRDALGVVRWMGGNK